MKPPVLDYVRATSVAEAVGLLHQHEGDAKLIAGGQSLMPMLNFRLLQPSVLIDINHLSELTGISEQVEGLRIGALTRHRELLESPLVAGHFPVLREAMGHVAHLAIRNRGTIGGSISHADPAAELPMLLCLLDARITIQGTEGGREVTPDAFFEGTLTSALEDDEIVTSILLPWLAEGMGWGFAEVARRHGDFAIAGAGCLLGVTDGRISEARLAVMGVDETPLRLGGAESELLGQAIDTMDIDRVIAAVRAGVSPNDDLHGSADYRRHLVGVLAGRIVAQALERAA